MATRTPAATAIVINRLFIARCFRSGGKLRGATRNEFDDVSSERAQSTAMLRSCQSSDIDPAVVTAGQPELRAVCEDPAHVRTALWDDPGPQDQASCAVDDRDRAAEAVGDARGS